jgi:RNA polymerase sigma factor (sigma-70 family)
VDSPGETAEPSAGSVGRWFATTHWSVVLAAGDPASPKAQQALETLCRAYWYPLYAYLRRTGRNPDDAEDLVQGFFLYLLQGQVLQSVEKEGGRFRSFLLGTLKNYVSDQKDKASAQKRGGGRPSLSLELAEAEHRFLREPADQESADRTFDRRWASALLERAMARLQDEWLSAGKAELFAHLKGFVSGEKGPTTYADAAAEANLSSGALKSAIHRLRQRYYELVREEVAHTLADPADLKEELRYLLSLFSSG